MKTPAQKIKNIREQFKLNKKQFAKEIGISYTYQRHVEDETGVYKNSQGHVPIPYLQKIAKRFNLPLVLIIRPSTKIELKQLAIKKDKKPTDD